MMAERIAWTVSEVNNDLALTIMATLTGRVGIGGVDQGPMLAPDQFSGVALRALGDNAGSDVEEAVADGRLFDAREVLAVRLNRIAQVDRNSVRSPRIAPAIGRIAVLAGGGSDREFVAGHVASEIAAGRGANELLLAVLSMSAMDNIKSAPIAHTDSI
jgi:hypothetical protein